MRLTLVTIKAIMMCCITQLCFAQSAQQTSLCSLQKKVAPGRHLHVRISGIYSAGPENSTLDDPACPLAPYNSTWVDFKLKAKRNDKKMRTLLYHSKRVYLESEGEFYGPPLPAPDLPQGAREAFSPRWGHLGCCRTKLIVHLIHDVKPVPADHIPSTH